MIRGWRDDDDDDRRCLGAVLYWWMSGSSRATLPSDPTKDACEVESRAALRFIEPRLLEIALVELEAIASANIPEALGRVQAVPESKRIDISSAVTVTVMVECGNILLEGANSFNRVVVVVRSDGSGGIT